MKKLAGVSVLALAALLYAGTPAVVAAKEDPKAKTEASSAAGATSNSIPPEMIAFEKSLHKQTGEVRIPEAKAVMHLGDRYYFLPADEAKRVLTEVWGNPPQASEGVLGLVLEKGTTIFDYTWGAVITFEDTGHISDDDAGTQDYAQVLTERQTAVESNNEQRKAQGYPAMHLIGWAQAPSYDKANHSLIWAREISVEGDPGNGLNYDVRLLGRTGVLSLNMIGSMTSINEVRGAAQAFGKSVTFEPGGAYTDYDSSTDHTADYGLAGLVAGGVGLAVAKKIGFLAIILKFGKVILIGIAAAGAAVVGLFRKMFGRREQDL